MFNIRWLRYLLGMILIIAGMWFISTHTFVMGQSGTGVIDKCAVNITNDSWTNLAPEISDQLIVWHDYRKGDDADIYAYVIDSKEIIPIATSNVDEYNFSVSGGGVVWQQRQTSSLNHDIYYFNYQTGQTTLITDPSTNQVNPDISGDIIVWEDNSHGSGDVYARINGNVVPISTATGAQIRPAIDGQRIVWIDYRHTNTEIYLYDLSTETEIRITNDTVRQYYPDISGDYIVWLETDSNNQRKLYYYSISEQRKTFIADVNRLSAYPRIYNKLVVWSDNPSGVDRVYIYHIDTGQKEVIEYEPLYGSQLTPAIYQNTIVWEDQYVGDIYANLCDLIPTPLPDWKNLLANWLNSQPDYYLDSKVNSLDWAKLSGLNIPSPTQIPTSTPTPIPTSTPTPITSPTPTPTVVPTCLGPNCVIILNSPRNQSQVMVNCEQYCKDQLGQQYNCVSVGTDRYASNRIIWHDTGWECVESPPLAGCQTPLENHYPQMCGWDVEHFLDWTYCRCELQ